MKKVFSGIQPSGIIHIGNYLGAIKNWLNFQEKYNCIFSIVDYHAITVKQEPEELRRNIRQTAAIYLAAGIDPTKSTIFVQSHVSAHTELCWILNCLAKIPELERMTQYKEKTEEYKKEANVGLFDYPVLMAADILLYKTELVPVGADQKQHVELTRDLAERFNHLFGETFVLPEPMIQKEGGRIMGLDNPLKKMSKSAGPANYISLLDSPDEIREKIKKAVTDSGSEIKYDEKKPAINNLLTIYSLLSGQAIADLEKKYEDKNYADFKKDLAEVAVGFLAPFQKKYQAISDQPDQIEKILAEGADRADAIASQTLKEVKEKVGIL